MRRETFQVVFVSGQVRMDLVEGCEVQARPEGTTVAFDVIGTEPPHLGWRAAANESRRHSCGDASFAEFCVLEYLHGEGSVTLRCGDVEIPDASLW